MRIRLGVLLFGLAAAGPVAAQGADTTLLRRVDSVFAQWSSTASPGCAVGVDRAGQPLLRRAYGMANLESGTPWTLGTLSESGSVAKQFTATAIVLLARDGALSLDDDIGRWIPEARGLGRKITIRAEGKRAHPVGVTAQGEQLLARDTAPQSSWGVAPLHGLFEARVRETPEAEAVVAGAQLSKFTRGPLHEAQTAE